MSFKEPIKQTKETQKLYDHIQWLNANAKYMDIIHERRLQVTMRILKKMREIIEDYNANS